MNFGLGGAGIGAAGIIAALLFSTASGNLSSIDGAFGMSSADWRVVCFAAGCLVVLLASVFLYFKRQ